MTKNYSLNFICCLVILLFSLPSINMKGQTMMPLPAHNNVYPGMVRGYWFTAPVNFTITGLRVCAEAGPGLQYIHVFKINDAVPVVYATSSTNFTTLAYIQGAPNNVIQTVNINVTSGDKIGILGTAGNDNSYSSSTAVLTTTIAGQPVTLARLLYQGLINTGPAPNYSTEPTTNAISRIEMWYGGSPNDLQGVVIPQPVNNSQHCSNTTVPLRAVIKNSGSAPQSNFMVGAQYVGPANGFISTTYTGTLIPNAPDTVNLGTVNLQSGNYTVKAYTMLSTDTLKTNDTTPSVNFTVQQPVLPPQAISDTVCAGGNATMSINPQPNMIYKWYSASSGGTLLSTGNTTVSFAPLAQDTVMYVSATSNGCESQRVFIAAAIGPNPMVNLGADTTFCESVPLMLNAGNPGGTYLWNTGASTQTITLTNQSGKYWVEVDKYCITSDTIDVNIAPLPVASGISYTRIGNTYYFSASSVQHVDSYLWLFGDGITSTASNPIHSYGAGINADLLVKLVVSNDCGTDTASRSIPTAIEGPGELNESIQIFPNPASDELFIQSSKAIIKKVDIINTTGSLVVKHEGWAPGTKKLDIHLLPAGNYVVRIQTDEGTLNRMLQIIR